MDMSKALRRIFLREVVEALSVAAVVPVVLVGVVSVMMALVSYQVASVSELYKASSRC